LVLKEIADYVRAKASKGSARNAAASATPAP